MTFSSRVDLPWKLSVCASASDVEAHGKQLFDLHNGSLRAYVLHILRDAVATDDIVQETFVRLLRQMKSGVPIANPQAWLFAVGRNLVADHLTDQARYTSIEEPASGAWRREQADPAPSAEQQCLHAERATRVERALKRLSPLETQCLRMRSAGMLYRQIAAALGVTISTVESALARAIRKMMTEAC
ncbi:MAG: RNA polymerase sigma factor [Acidobacteria bacterium]|nr:RNA polymerase sigma factor [Acidobacteriota bacterium]